MEPLSLEDDIPLEFALREQRLLDLAWKRVEYWVKSKKPVSLEAAKFAIVKLSGQPAQSARIDLDARVRLTKESAARKLVENLKILGLVK